jgi:hypothetical protein
MTTPEAQPDAPTPRHFQFSLATLIVFVTGVCVALSLLRWHWTFGLMAAILLVASGWSFAAMRAKYHRLAYTLATPAMGVAGHLVLVVPMAFILGDHLWNLWFSTSRRLADVGLDVSRGGSPARIDTCSSPEGSHWHRNRCDLRHRRHLPFGLGRGGHDHGAWDWHADLHIWRNSQSVCRHPDSSTEPAVSRMLLFDLAEGRSLAASGWWAYYHGPYFAKPKACGGNTNIWRIHQSRRSLGGRISIGHGWQMA